MKHKILSLTLLGLLCSVGMSWADVIWESDFIETISGVTQEKGRNKDTWGTTTDLNWAKDTYSNCFNAGGSSSTLTLTFTTAKSIPAKSTLHIYWGAVSNRTLTLQINGSDASFTGGHIVDNTTEKPRSTIMDATYTFTTATSLTSFKLGTGGSGTYWFHVSIVSPCTVTYDGNGSTGGEVPSDGSSPYVSGSTVTVLGNTGSLVKTGNAFTGWNTKANGSGTGYAPGAEFTISENTTLYAQWATAYAVTYNGNGNTGGSVPVDANTYASGSSVIVLGNTGDLEKSGEGFVGWNTQDDGNGTSYAPGDNFKITENTTLYAQWEVLSAPTFITISGAGTYAKNAEATLTVTDVDGAPVPTINWYTSNSTGTELSEDPIATGTSYSPSTSDAGVFYFVAVATNSQDSYQSAVQTITVKPATPTITKGDFNFANKGYAVTLTNKEATGDLKIKIGSADWANYAAAIYATTTTSYQAKVVVNGAESDVVSLGVTNTFDPAKSYVAWVYTKGYGSKSYAFATDPMVIALQGIYNVVECDGGTSAPKADWGNADLIVCTEAMSGGNTLSNGMKSFAGVTPMIGLKAYNYTKGRWSWGTPANPKSTTQSFTPKSSLYKLFEGVTFESDGKIKLATTGSGNVIQTVEFGTTDCTAPTGNVIMGTIDGADAKAVMYASNKYFGLGLSSDCWSTYTQNAVTIVKNAAAMLIANEALDTEVSSVSGTISDCGWSTFSSRYPLNLGLLSGADAAYVVSAITDSKAVLSPATGKVPSGTGLMIKGDAGEEFTIKTTSETTTAPATNLLVGVPDGTTVTAANNTSEWNYVFGWETGEEENPGFYLINSTSATLTAGKAYLHTTAVLGDNNALAPSVIRIVEEESNATNLGNIEATDEAVKFIQDGQLFIKKNGVIYDAMGRIIR